MEKILTIAEVLKKHPEGLSISDITTSTHIYKAEGCPKCMSSGYTKRTGIFLIYGFISSLGAFGFTCGFLWFIVEKILIFITEQ